MQLGCVADDLTGATDLANELVSRGLRTVQIIGVPNEAPRPDADAVVIALKSRSIDPQDAVDVSLAALEWLRAAGCPRFYFKYCSTFDSTPRGNIGPVLEAMARALGVSAVIACPAFPATGRTVYLGHLFVGDRLLNESGMQDHPLNPMTDANLVRVLQAQMRGTVGLLRHADLTADAIGGRLAGFIADEVGAVVADAVDDRDLEVLGAYCAGVRLSSGGSGLGAGLARALAGPDAPRASAPLPPSAGLRRAVIAGSCSQATRRQIEAARQVYPAFRIALAKDQTADAVVAAATAWIDRHKGPTPIILYSTASPDEVAAQRDAYAGDVSAVLEGILAEVAAHLVAQGVGALVVAGGETSGAVVQRLGCALLEIGPEIDPGVPWTIGRRPDGQPLLLALKSGNFGADDFLIKAWDHLP